MAEWDAAATSFLAATATEPSPAPVPAASIARASHTPLPRLHDADATPLFPLLSLVFVKTTTNLKEVSRTASIALKNLGTFEDRPTDNQNLNNYGLGIERLTEWHTVNNMHVHQHCAIYRIL